MSGGRANAVAAALRTGCNATEAEEIEANIPERHDSRRAVVEEQSANVAAPDADFASSAAGVDVDADADAGHRRHRDVYQPSDDVDNNNAQQLQQHAQKSSTTATQSALVTSLLRAAIADGMQISLSSSPSSNPHPYQTTTATATHARPGCLPQLKTTSDMSSSSSTSPAQQRPATPHQTPTIFETPVEAARPAYSSPIPIVAKSASMRSNLSAHSITSSHSPASTSSMLASPYLAAMADITPLPSPIMSSEPPTAAWQRHRNNTTISAKQTPTPDDTTRSARASSVSSIPMAEASPRRKKQFGSLLPTATASATANLAHSQENSQAGLKHGRNRSISEFVPENLHNVRQRVATIGSSDQVPMEYQMSREANLAERRGLLSRNSDPSQILPSPPPSNTSVAESEDADDDQVSVTDEADAANYLHIHCGIHNRLRRFRQIRQLGQGTFSKVMLATSQRSLGPNPAAIPEENLDPSRLVAVKIVEHGPAGGADEERIEIGLRREVEMLKSVSHPSLIHLKACEDQSTRTLLVLTYCPGGDLFELASDKRDLLTPVLIQRIFAELVSAVRYLHTQWIVHRDIKLENVLVNYRLDQLRQIDEPITHKTPIITLSDLGLSRTLPDPPLLTTRCGSEDYAAPEILLGQPYDGRLTDGWALGVLLYALMEGRLPFDAPPGKPDRSRNTHRIARCDWIWCRFGDDDGEWDPQRGAQFEGARQCVEGLLKKVRMGRKPLEEIEQSPWVQQGIQVPGGLQTRPQDLDELQ